MSVNHLQNNATADIYTDLQGLQNLKTSARKDAQAALPEVARQFEAVMISMMIKNMRKTGMEDPIFKSQAMDSYRDMYDQQLSMELSKGQGIGLAQSIVQQLQHQAGNNSADPDVRQTVPLSLPQRRRFPDHYSAPVNVQAPQRSDDSDFSTPEQFVRKLWPMAEKTAKKLGVTAEIILSQAALETGWGKHVITEGEKSSFNLFNIKADQSWQGERMGKTSMEYIHGKPVQQISDFRAYHSFEQSFADYANFIQNNPRYKMKPEQSLHRSIRTAIQDSDYIKTLHKAGYATDPDYANKVLRVLNSDVIQNQRQNPVKLVSK